MSNLLRLLLFILAVEKVFTLKCFTTKYEKLTSGKVKIWTSHLQECNDYLNETNQLEYSSRSHTSPIVDYRCFTIMVHRDNSNTHLNIGGCGVEGGCQRAQEIMKPVVLSVTGTSGESECSECQGDGCNKLINSAIKMRNVDVSVGVLLVVALVLRL